MSINLSQRLPRSAQKARLPLIAFVLTAISGCASASVAKAIVTRATDENK